MQAIPYLFGFGWLAQIWRIRSLADELEKTSDKQGSESFVEHFSSFDSALGKSMYSLMFDLF
jgi:hypothetical protein